MRYRSNSSALLSHLPLPVVDAQLRHLIESASRDSEDFWAFRDYRAYATAMYQYPAMMVPEVQRELISAIMALQGHRMQSLLDPFLGSGTVALEGIRQGLDVTGQDINPMAILVSSVRTGPFLDEVFETAINTVLNEARHDTITRLRFRFPGITKWYVRENALGLYKLRRAILRVKSLPARRFLWVVLAETARLTSNSRTSTYKLHIRKRTDIKNMSNRDPLDMFSTIAERNLLQLRGIKAALLDRGLLIDQAMYPGRVDIRLGDSAQELPPAPNGRKYDLLVTSPPYGDNLSTVPYGQNSFLPLQWIELRDIGPDVTPACLQTTLQIDRDSLGGLWKRENLDLELPLFKRSPSLRKTIEALADKPLDRSQRVYGFVKDLDRALATILPSLRRNAYMVWTVGNRRVGDREVPTDQILSELLSSYGAKEVTRLTRPIVSKRMAEKNAIAATMTSEIILVFRNAQDWGR